MNMSVPEACDVDSREKWDVTKRNNESKIGQRLPAYLKKTINNKVILFFYFIFLL